MNTMDSKTWVVIAIIAVALIAVAVWVLYQRRQSARLKQRFGPEYSRTVAELGDRTKAESELKEREKRVRTLNIVPLSVAEASRFTRDWKALQSRFIDNPRGVVSQADKLVRELMQKRGYPMTDFERCAADVSVDHPAVVNNYRQAQAITERDARGAVSTEELRKAVVHYRALFDELLEVKDELPPKDLSTKSMEVPS
jgi:FtsZ-interacting cell division protein ZipA